MTSVALETTFVSTRTLASFASCDAYFFPLRGDSTAEMRCHVLDTEPPGLWNIRVGGNARLQRAARLVEHLWRCYRDLDAAPAVSEYHVSTLLATVPVWLWRRRHQRRGAIVAYVQRTDMLALDRGARRVLAWAALRCADVLVVESDEVRAFLCESFRIGRGRIYTIEDLTSAPQAAPMTALFMHPERRALFDLCRGQGIDVGCGSNKTHPAVIGVDLTPKGTPGSYGNQRWQISEADVVSAGDDLATFANASLDYVVERHNLEHYLDPVKALLEWRRVLRQGGVLGMVVPDDAAIDTIPLDPTHKHAFTMESLARLIGVIGGFEIVENRVCIPGWSFVLVAKKSATEQPA